MELRELAELRRAPPRRGRAGRRRQARAARARPARPARRRPRPARGRPGAREDPDRALVRRGERARLQPRPVHARPAPGRRDGLVDLEPARRATSSSAPGPIFTHLLLADEINRAPPKTQAALLEAMQERQVTTDGVTRPLERPFLVLATQNPIEYEGTYPLPEAQLDRFLLRTGFGYPAADAEWEMLARRHRAPRGRRRADPGDRPARRCSRCRRAVELVHVDASRRPLHRRPRRGDAREPRASPSARARAAASRSLKLSRCRAALAGRDFVTPTT